MGRFLVCLVLSLALTTGCARSRVTLESISGPVAAVSASELAAGDALYPFQAASGQWGYMDATGRVVLDPVYRAAEPFSEGRAKVRIGDAYGFIDPGGELVIPARYSSGEAFSQGRALVTEGTAKRMRYGFIDPAGHVLVPLVLPLAYSYNEGRALVRFRDQDLTWFQRMFRASKQESLGFIALDGQVVFDLPGEAASFSNGLAPFSEPGMLSGGRWGYVRPDGAVAIAPIFEGSAFRFSDGLARVTHNGAFAFVDSTGRPAFSETYELAHSFSEGRAAVRVGDRWGYIGTTGALAIEPRFEEAGAFSEGLAAVRIEGQWGYINRDGQLEVEPAFRAAYAFDRGLAYVTDASGSHYIDRAGRPIRPSLASR